VVSWEKGERAMEGEVVQGLTMLTEATIMLKPLQSKGAVLDRNHAETKFINEQARWNACCNNQRKNVDIGDSQVNGLIARGDKKLAIDWTPATNPCVFPCSIPVY
jgi:hypothetical protein